MDEFSEWINKGIESISDPKKKLEYLLDISAIAIGYFYIYVYQDILHLHVTLLSMDTILQIPVISLIVVPIILYVFIKPDPLQRSPSNRQAIRFFQNEFPSNYILSRCGRCIEDDRTCQNFIKAESFAHVRYWFNDIFHDVIEKANAEVVKNTFEKGYTCKLVYYLTWIILAATVLSLLTIIFNYIVVSLSTGYWLFRYTTLHLIFLIVGVIMVWLINIFNNPDDKNPTGCWQAWREINRIHVSWMQSQEALLVNLICHSGGSTKRFKEK